MNMLAFDMRDHQECNGACLYIYTHVHTASDLPCMHAYADMGYIRRLFMHACVCM